MENILGSNYTWIGCGGYCNVRFYDEAQATRVSLVGLVSSSKSRKLDRISN